MRDRESAPQTMPYRQQNLETVSGWVRNPQDVCTAVKQRVRYTRDRLPEDQWKDGRQTWRSGTGDCEDFAVLIKKLCRENNIQADVYRFYPPTGSGHVVALGEWNGRLWMSSNGSFVEVYSFEDAKRRVARSQGWSVADMRVRKGEKKNRQSSTSFTESSWR